MSDISMDCWAFSTRVLVFTGTVDSPSLAHLALCGNLSHAPGGYTFSLQSGEKKCKWEEMMPKDTTCFWENISKEHKKPLTEKLE